MRTSTSSLLLLSAALAASTSPARALVSLGSDAKLFATLNASAQYNDNLFLSAPRTSDTLFEAAPGLLLQFGQGALVSGQAYYNERFQAYSDNSNLNTSLSQLGATVRYNDQKSKVAFDGSFAQANQATRDIRNQSSLVRRNVSNAVLTDEYLLSEKTSFSVGGAFSDTDYKRQGYVDYRTVSIPVKYYYKVVPKLDLSGGYRYRKNTLGAAGLNSSENFYSVGARGELTPKLTGELSAGYNQFKPTNGHSSNGLGLEASLVYAYSPKTNVTFGANEGYSYSALGEANRIAGLNAGISAALSSDWRADAGVIYSRYSYLASNRRDDFYMAQTSATYTVNEYVSLTAAYAYANNSSNAAGATFTNNIVSVSAAFKY